MYNIYLETLTNLLTSLKATGTFEDIKKLKTEIEINNMINATLTLLNNNVYSTNEKQEVLKALKEYATPEKCNEILKKR